MASSAFDTRHAVSAEDRVFVIDAVNRLNFAFDEWNIEAMVAAFTDDGVVHHARGDVRGHDELLRFHREYHPLTLGVRRQALNHVVDGLPDGQIRVTSYNLLIRVALAEDHAKLRQTMISEYDDYPGIFIHALVVDTFRKDDGFDWRIAHRSAEQNVINKRYRG